MFRTQHGTAPKYCKLAPFTSATATNPKSGHRTRKEGDDERECRLEFHDGAFTLLDDDMGTNTIQIADLLKEGTREPEKESAEAYAPNTPWP